MSEKKKATVLEFEETDGVIFDGTHRMPQCVKDAIVVLDALPDGKLISMKRLGQLVGTSFQNSTLLTGARVFLLEYRHRKDEHKYWYGNKTTIQNWKEGEYDQKP